MKTQKPWTEMTTAELRVTTKDLNGSVLHKARPMNAQERALWQKAGKVARKVSSKTTKVENIRVTLDSGLLKDADKAAKERGLDRSELISEALAAVLGRKAS